MVLEALIEYLENGDPAKEFNYDGAQFRNDFKNSHFDANKTNPRKREIITFLYMIGRLKNVKNIIFRHTEQKYHYEKDSPAKCFDEPVSPISTTGYQNFSQSKAIKEHCDFLFKNHYFGERIIVYYYTAIELGIFKIYLAVENDIS